jgi:hypothetical protein
MYERLLNGLGADEAVYFADAVHPEYQTKPAFGWVKAGSNPAVTTTPGRSHGHAVTNPRMKACSTVVSVPSPTLRIYTTLRPASPEHLP